MCDCFSWQMMQRNNMESHSQGDLTDIVRSTLPTSSDKQIIIGGSDWQQFSTDDDDLFCHQLVANSTTKEEEFGDPFANSADPSLLHEFIDVSSSGQIQPVLVQKISSSSSSTTATNTVVLAGEELKKTPASNLFSRMLNLTPPTAAETAAGVVLLKPSPLSPTGIRPSPGCSISIDNNAKGISRPESSATGMKRRKTQAKKVVCVPAPAVAAASNRQSGEVVPSDLWAWRKYGQKPIKGSPYPRGYYRCSSSKGCSARKQVERSRTDPNMLVITYTSEHNHPWPTHRNALAGSTRSHQFPKNNNNNNNSNSSSSSSLTNKNSHQFSENNINKEEVKDRTCNVASLVKEEVKEITTEGTITEASTNTTIADQEHSHEWISDDFHQSYYRPMIPDSPETDDFFADLAELESDPMNLIFSSRSNNDLDYQKLDGEVIKNSKELEQIFFDWSTGER